MTGSHTQKKQMTPDIWIEEQFKTYYVKKKIHSSSNLNMSK